MAAASSPVVTIYKNGDRNFHGKKIVVNRRYYRNFENFLDKITQDTRAGVAIRKIHTPHHGTKVDSLESIQDGATYVAAGSEKFRQLSYGETSKPTSNSSSPITNHHSKTVAAAESRYKKEAMAEPLKNRIIFVYRNGEKKAPPVRLLVDKRSLSSMDVFLQFISDKMKLTGGAVKFMYSLDTMAKVADVGDIKTNMSYVAVGCGKAFAKGKYGDVEVKGGRKRGEDGRVVNTGSTYTLPPPDDDKANVVTTPEMLSPLSNTCDADELEAPSDVDKTDDTIGTQVEETQSVDMTSPSEPAPATSSPVTEEASVNEATQTDVSVAVVNEADADPVDPDQSNTTDLAESEPVPHVRREGTYDGNKPDDGPTTSTDDEEGHADGVVEQLSQDVKDVGEVTDEKEAIADAEEETIVEEAKHEADESTENISADADVATDDDAPTAENEVVSDTVPEDAADDVKIITDSIENNANNTGETVPEDETITVITSSEEANDEDEAQIKVVDETNPDTEIIEAPTEQAETVSELDPDIPESNETELFKASGEQEESGEQVADDKNTAVEELIDKVPAVEVEEDITNVREYAG